LEPDHFERKYHLALERMEREEASFRELEEQLRRIASRLLLLARGRDDALDGLLERVTDAVRRSSAGAGLSPLVDELGDAVARLDGVPSHAQAGGTLAPAPRWPEALRETLLRVVLIPSLAEEAVEIRAQLTAVAVDDDAAMPLLAEAVANLVNRQRDSLRADIDNLQALLEQVSGRLEEMTHFLELGMNEQSQDLAEGEALDTTVRDEMALLSQTARDATSLADLQEQVSSRLALIDQHFREYRERQDARAEEFRARTASMQGRLVELETQALRLQESLAREHELALTDPLTAMPNRLAYERHVDDVHRRWQGERQHVCVAAFDIDHFKAINDSYGHAAGDAVLRIVGKALSAHAAGRYFIARYGGEEFAAVFDGLERSEALVMAEDLCRCVAVLGFHASKRPIAVTMSGGITCFQMPDTPVAAFERADRALYEAKRAGRNCCVVG
jgi:diguanylate cyclase